MIDSLMGKIDALHDGETNTFLLQGFIGAKPVKCGGNLPPIFTGHEAATK